MTVLAWHGIRFSLGVVNFPNVKTLRKNNNLAVPNKVALEAWLTGLHRILGVSEIGSALLALQITELEVKCAALRKRMLQRAGAHGSTHKRRVLRSAA